MHLEFRRSKVERLELKNHCVRRMYKVTFDSDGYCLMEAEVNVMDVPKKRSERSKGTRQTMHEHDTGEHRGNQI